MKSIDSEYFQCDEYDWCDKKWINLCFKAISVIKVLKWIYNTMELNQGFYYIWVMVKEKKMNVYMIKKCIIEKVESNIIFYE